MSDLLAVQLLPDPPVFADVRYADAAAYRRQEAAAWVRSWMLRRRLVAVGAAMSGTAIATCAAASTFRGFSEAVDPVGCLVDLMWTNPAAADGIPLPRLT